MSDYTAVTQTIDDLKAQIATLQEELRLARQRSEFCCPLCGSNLTKSTTNNRFFCKQDNGLCGELRLGHKKRTPCDYSARSKDTAASIG